MHSWAFILQPHSCRFAATACPALLCTLCFTLYMDTWKGLKSEGVLIFEIYITCVNLQCQVMPYFQFHELPVFLERCAGILSFKIALYLNPFFFSSTFHFLWKENLVLPESRAKFALVKFKSAHNYGTNNKKWYWGVLDSSTCLPYYVILIFMFSMRESFVFCVIWTPRVLIIKVMTVPCKSCNSEYY